MKYWFNDLGSVSGGGVVEVVLNVSANVQVMEEEDFFKYKNNLPHEFIGGYVRFAPYRVKIPRAGHWYVAVDLGGYPGEVRAAFNVYAGRRPPKVNTVFLPEIEK